MVFSFRFKEEILLEQGEVKLSTDALFYQKPPETGHPVISYFFQNFFCLFFFILFLFMVWSCRWCAQVFQHLVKNCSNDCIDQKLLQIHGFVLLLWLAGGESAWGEPFRDEFKPNLIHQGENVEDVIFLRHKASWRKLSRRRHLQRKCFVDVKFDTESNCLFFFRERHSKYGKFRTEYK